MTRIELFKEDMKFSAAHFTIFGKDERERLHGHNFQVSVEVESEVNEDGLAFNYQELKNSIRSICKDLDEFTLLPNNSPHLKLEQNKTHVYAHFNNERIPFLKSDTLILPIRNITIEELAKYILNKLDIPKNISKTTVKVSSGPGQWASATK